MYDSIRWWQRLICILGGVMLLILLWNLALSFHLVSDVLLPPPKKVGIALIRLFESTSFWIDIATTLWTWITGVILGTILGTVAGIVLGLNRYIWAVVEPWVEFFRVLPSVVLVPFVSLFLGVGASSRLACTTLVVVALLIATAGSALRSATREHLRLAKSWRAKQIQTIKHFLLPAAISHIIVALKAAIPLALIVAVAADMLIATEAGIGKVIMDSLSVFNTPTMYASMIIVGLLGYISTLIGSTIERISIHWRTNDKNFS